MGVILMRPLTSEVFQRLMAEAFPETYECQAKSDPPGSLKVTHLAQLWAQRDDRKMTHLAIES